jgi:hypothetical protein
MLGSLYDRFQNPTTDSTHLQRSQVYVPLAMVDMTIRLNGLTGNSPTGLGISLQHADSPASGLSSNARDTSIKILDIIYEHALNKFDDSKERLAAGTSKFLSVIDRFVLADERVETCLPAFPFKSANKVYKVLGSLPDKAEELALQRLNDMCARIKDVYKPGARVTIISDGITYNGMWIYAPFR